MLTAGADPFELKSKYETERQRGDAFDGHIYSLGTSWFE